MKFVSLGVVLGLFVIGGISPACLGAKPQAQERAAQCVHAAGLCVAGE